MGSSKFEYNERNALIEPSGKNDLIGFSADVMISINTVL